MFVISAMKPRDVLNMIWEGLCRLDKVVQILVCMTVLKIVNLLVSMHQLVGIVTLEKANVFNWGEVVVIVTLEVRKMLVDFVSEVLITIP